MLIDTAVLSNSKWDLRIKKYYRFPNDSGAYFVLSWSTCQKFDESFLGHLKLFAKDSNLQKN